MLTRPQFMTIVRASAAYDLIVTAPFATPWTFALVMQLLAGSHVMFGLPGEPPAAGGMTTLFANLMGSVVVVWSVVRLQLNLPLLGRYDAVARLLFACWQLHALLNGASWVIAPFLVVEICFAMAQALPVRDKPQTV